MMADRRSGVLYRRVDDLFGRGTVAGMEEGRLLERFVAEGDEAAFEALVARFGPMVLGVCRRVLDDPEDVEDAFQATFLILVQKAGNLRDGTLVGNWLYGVAYRVARRARVNARRRRHREGAKSEDEAMARARSQSHDAEWLDLRRVLDEEVSRLPEKYRVPVCLCYLQDQSYEEAAERLNWPIGTVRSRLAKARELMRTRLVRRGVVLPASLLAAALQPEVTRAAVSAGLLERTLATTLRGGAAATAGGGSAVAVRLAHDAMTAMTFASFKAIAGVALLVGTVGVGALLLAQSAGEKEPPRRIERAEQGQPPGGRGGLARGGGASEGSTAAAAKLAFADDANVGGLETSKVVRQFVAQLRKEPARLSRAAERNGLYLIDVAKGEVTLIAEEPGPGLTHCGSAWWWSDGGRILFDATPKNQFDQTHLESIALDDGRLVRTDLGPGNCPSLSPDGRRIAFLQNSGAVAGAESGVWLMDADGSGRRHLGGYGRVKWAPDGGQLLVVAFSTPPKPTTMALLDVETGGERPLGIPGHRLFSVPSWAGAGTIVAAIGPGELADRIALVDVSDPEDAKIKEVLWKTDDPVEFGPAYPVMVPETGRCVFVGERGTERGLFTMRRGELPRRLDVNGTSRVLTDLAIAPDGEYVIFCGNWQARVGKAGVR